MRFRWSHVIAAGFILVAMNLRAYADDTTADVRCVAAVLSLTGNADATTKTSLVMGALYYIGRLDGRVPLLDLEEALVKELSTMTATEIGSEAVRCGGALSVRGEQITKIGEHLIERGKSMSAEPPKAAK